MPNYAPSHSETPSIRVLGSGLHTDEILALSKIFGNKGVTDAVRGAVPSDSTTKLAFSVQVQATMQRGASQERRPTLNILRKALPALLIQRLGLDAEQALAVFTDVFQAAAMLDEDGERKLLEEHPEVEQAYQAVDLLADQLPKLHAEGPVKFVSLELARVEVPARPVTIRPRTASRSRVQV